MNNGHIKLNTKDIAATIVEEGFMIGKNNAVNISLDCDALEIYTNMKSRNPLLNIIKKPKHAGTLYFKRNGEILDSWNFQNKYIGEPINNLKDRLEQTYGVTVTLKDEYEVVWGDDPAI